MTKSGSDTECQQPPTSPTKVLNRRIKAIPKLHQRRTSFSIGSASESEEDIRRSGIRNRNDSVSFRAVDLHYSIIKFCFISRYAQLTRVSMKRNLRLKQDLLPVGNIQWYNANVEEQNRHVNLLKLEENLT